MIITKLKIQNFRSFKDSGIINLEKNITTILAKNEQGKTNFLKAIASFSKNYEYSYDDFCSYSTYDILNSASIPIVTLYFKTTSDDRELLKEYNEELSKISEFSITKYYDNHYEKEIIRPKKHIDLMSYKMDEIEQIKVGINNILNSFKENITTLSEQHPPFKVQMPTFYNSIEKININMNEIFEKNDFKNIFIHFYSTLRNLPDKNEEITNSIEQTISQIDSYKNKLLALHDDSVLHTLLNIIPSFSYFTNIDLLKDNVNIDEYLNNQEKYRTFNNLFELSNLSIKNLPNKPFFMRRFETDEASATITGLVNKSWTQEKVKVNIGCDGDNLFVYIEDEIGARDPPSRRSDGFQWYLSFYTNFVVNTRGELKGAVLLLDNPGSLLHAAGQKDLLKTLNNISKNNQIIFTTHSPFLIDKNRLDIIRILEKKKNKVGTKVKEKFWESQYDALEPIRAAIGCRISDSLFGSKNNVLVEGFSDRIYIESLAKYNSKRGHASLDLSKILINCAGGADKMPWLAGFVKIEKYDTFIILDNDNKGRKVKRDIQKRYDISEDDIFTLDMLDDEYSGNDLEIEDLIDESVFNNLVNMAYREIFRKKLRKRRIDIEDLPEEGLIINKYITIFKDNDIGDLDKIIIAKELRELSRKNDCSDEDIGIKTIENFSKLFNIINHKFE